MLHFYKYQATGNDFIMLDNRMSDYNNFGNHAISRICDRRFGIGADGMILIQEHPELDFEMVYFNADGSQSLCGNGSRAAVMFAHHLGIIGNLTTFLTIAGELNAIITDEIIHLHMPDVSDIKKMDGDFFIHNGSPHYIKFIQDAETFDIETEGPEIRYSSLIAGGTNANFIQEIGNNEIFVRTWERGVEAETYSCGTGVTACALACSLKNYKSPVAIRTRGGNLQVSFEKDGKGGFKNIYLIGPAEKVFEGDYYL